MERKIGRNGGICKKCGSETGDTLDGRQCERCFVASLRHKFRSSLGKSRLIRRGDTTILLAHSGKANSSALLRLVRDDCENEQLRRKLLLRPKVLYIDDGAVKGRTVEERETVVRSVLEEVRNLRLIQDSSCGIAISLARCLDENFSLDVDKPLVNADGDARLQKIFDELEDDTARDELLRRLRRKLLVAAARELGCDKVFLADTLTELAIKVLADVSTGRAAHLVVDVGFTDTRCPDVTLVRPMKDLTSADVARYLKLERSTAVLEDPERPSYFLNSVRSIARRFVHELDAEFPSTVPTIYRTSEKLRDRSTPETGDARTSSCVLCEVTLDLSASAGDQRASEELSAVRATSFSRKISSVSSSPAGTSLAPTSLAPTSLAQGITEILRSEENYRTGDCANCKCANCKTPLSHDLRKFLCYGCALIFSRSDGKSTLALPSFVSSAIRERILQTLMREEITDFLL